MTTDDNNCVDLAEIILKRPVVVSMWGTLLLLCVIFVSISARETDSKEWQPGWIPGMKYIYGVQSTSLTSQNDVGDQHVGVVTEALLELQLNKGHSGQLNAKVKNAKYAEVHTLLSVGWDAAISNLSSWKPLYLEYPAFAITIKNGQIKKIIVNKETSDYETNIYRAMISPLILNPGGIVIAKNGSFNNDSSCESSGKNNGFYSVMEETVMGRCQTQYGVSPLPLWMLQTQSELAPSVNIKSQLHAQTFLDIVKTTNFSRCAHRALYHHGLGPRGHADSGDSAVGSAFAHSSTTRQIVEGTLNSYLLHSAVTTSQFEASLLLYNEKRAKVTSRMNVTLVKATWDEIDFPHLPENAQKRSLQLQIVPRALQGLNADIDKDNIHTRNTQGKAPRHYFEERIPKNSEDLQSRESEWRTKNHTAPPGTKRSVQKIGNAAYATDNSTKTIYNSDSSNSDSCNSSSGILDDSSSEEDGLLKKPALQFPSVNPHFPIYSQDSNLYLVENIAKICNMIGEDVSESKNVIDDYTLHKFMLLVRLVRNASFNQLQKATETLYTPEGKSAFDSRRLAWEALRDASAQAGTGPALIALRGWVRERRVSSLEAASFIAALPRAARLPSSSYMAFFFEHFVHDEEVRSLPPLYSASLLAFTDLLRQAYVEGRLANARYPVHMYRGLALGSKLPPRFYVGYLARRLQRAVVRGSSRDAQLLIRALGNVGDHSVAQALAPFLRGAAPGAPPGAARVTAFQRVAMVTALAPLAAAEPDAARALAFSVFRNQEEAYEVRVAAVFVLMCAQPPADLLQRLAQSTHWERSPHVVAAVRSAIQSAAALTDPRRKQLAKNARAALGLLNSQPLSVQYSRSYVKDYFIHSTRNMGYSFIHNYIGSNDHIIPKAFYMGISRYLGGMDMKKERMSAMVSSVSQLLRVLGGGESTNAPLEAQLRFPVPGGDAFLPLDQDDFARLRSELQGMALALEEGGAFNCNKLYSGARMSLALPDAAGNVVYYAYRTPSLISLQVKGQGHVEADIAGVKRVQAEGSMNFRYATMESGHLGFVNNFSKNPVRYLTALEREVMLILPLHMNFTYYQDHQEQGGLRGVTMSLEALKLRKGPIEVARMRVEPYTTVQAADDITPPALSKEKRFINVRPPSKVTHDLGAVVVDVLTQGDQSAGDRQGGAWAWEGGAGALALLAFPLACTHNMHADQRLSVRPDVLQKITLNARYGEMSPQNKWSSEKPPLQYSGNETEKNKQNDTFSQTDDFRSQLVDLGIKLESPIGAGIAQASMNYTSCPSSNTDSFRLHYNFSLASRSALNKEMRSRVLQKLDIEANGKWAQVPLFDMKDAFKTSPDSSITGKLIYSSDFTTDHPAMEITAKCHLRRSAGRLRVLQNDARATECRRRASQGQRLHPSCLAATRRAGALDAVQCDARLLHLRPELIDAAFAMAEAWVPRATLTPAPPGGQVRAALQMQLSGSDSSLSASLRGPAMAWEVNNMPLVWLAAEVFTAHPSYSLSQRLTDAFLQGGEQPLCILEQNFITTLENHTFAVDASDAGDCWVVLMAFSDFKAPTGKNVTVLGRGKVGGDNSWAVRILLGDDVSITMAPTDTNRQNSDLSVLISSLMGLKVWRNHFSLARTESQVMSSRTVITKAGQLKLTVRDDKFTSVELPTQGLVVFYSDSGVIMQVDKAHSDKVNGLCRKFKEITISKFSRVVWNSDVYKAMPLCRLSSKRFPENSRFYPAFTWSNLHINYLEEALDNKPHRYSTDSSSYEIPTSDMNYDNSLLYEFDNSTSESSDSSSSYEKN